MTGAAEGSAAKGFLRRWMFGATIFTGSFLLFLVQPMIARMALPRLGGAPAVWNSAMLVYQALLLAGYAYAHWLTRLASRTQAMIHLAALLTGCIFLPIGLSAAVPPSSFIPALWVPWLLLTSIGPLFFLVAANAPILQRWFDLGGASNPYRLFAASNLGSFGGLIAYPLFLEPLMPVSAQRLLWSAGYVLLALMILGCATVVWRAGKAPEPVASLGRVEVRTLLQWIWLAFIPSGLMLSTTLFLTTDLSPLPLLWVIPLGLYLLSFTLAFWVHEAPARLIAIIAPYLLVPAGIAMFIGDRLTLMITIAVLLAALFAISTALHYRLYQSRPDPARLTTFYLAVATGGALGGLFCAILAPLLFDWTYEYPLLLLAAAVTIAPGWSPILKAAWWRRPRIMPVALGLSAGAVIAAGILGSMPRNDAIDRYSAAAALILASLAVGSRLLLTSLLIAAMLLAGAMTKLELSLNPGKLTRTYFGVYSIIDHESSRQLLHGTTLHGIQLLTPRWEEWQTTYYGRESGVGRALQLAPSMFGPRAAISVVGLGTGTLACYRQAQQRWTFFELDPEVVQLARTSGQFSFLARCAPDAHIVIGDARLELAKAPPASADILVVDAFSSDAVPMHLLTREAFAIYARHLKPHGLLLMHISNRHLDLEPVIVAAPGWTIRVGSFNPKWDYRQLTASDWVALSRSPATIEALDHDRSSSFWVESDRVPRRWTDDHASLLSVLN